MDKTVNLLMNGYISCQLAITTGDLSTIPWANNSLPIYMQSTGKMQITHKRVLEKIISVKKLWPKQNIL